MKLKGLRIETLFILVLHFRLVMGTTVIDGFFNHQSEGEPLNPAAMFWLILITAVNFSGEG